MTDLKNSSRLIATATAVLALGLLAGCGSTSDHDATTSAKASHTHGSGRSDDSDGMSGMSMQDMNAMSGGPSDTARMVCSDEIRDAVKRAFTLTAEPTPTHRWDKSSRLFTCTYPLPSGDLVLTVQDARDATRGRTYFDDLRTTVSNPRTIHGVQSVGLPAYENKAGDVVFIKDGKTLHVDATRISTTGLPPGFDRNGVAYAVASAVVACWSE